MSPEPLLKSSHLLSNPLDCRLAKHVYYPGGVSVTAEKPLIYDKIENLGLGGTGGAPGHLDTTYQTTALSTFRQETPGPSSLESSCSALCSKSDKHCANIQVLLCNSPSRVKYRPF